MTRLPVITDGTSQSEYTIQQRCVNAYESGDYSDYPSEYQIYLAINHGLKYASEL